jgi:aminoglycoside 3-N-acetyltransferase
MATTLSDLQHGLSELNLPNAPVIVHASLKSFGQVEGGAETVVEALAGAFKTVIVPTFTYKTMVTPLTGPPDNAIRYGSGEDLNRMAEFFSPDLPADPLMGAIPETLRQDPEANRSNHPILSFAGINAGKFLAAQSLVNPLAVLFALEKFGGYVVLMGVDHTVNTSIHYAEKLAGRRQFVRWALTPEGIVECPGFPGCSAGFQAIAPDLEKDTRQVTIGEARVQALSLKSLFRAVMSRIRLDPLALLCDHQDCERCNQIRSLVQAAGSPS